MRERFLFWASLIVLAFSLLVGFSTAKLTAEHEARIRRQEDLMRQQILINARVADILEQIAKDQR